MGRARRAGLWIMLAAAVGLSGCGLPVVGAASRPGSTRAAAAGNAVHAAHAAAAAHATTTMSVAAAPPAPSGGIVARAQRTHEIPTPAPAERAAGGWRSPVQAVQVFAQCYINWTAATVASHLHVLSQVAVGQARSAMTQAAGQVGHDSSITLGGIANSGTVEAIAPVTGERDVYAVVTRERTTATHTSAYEGLRPGWHVTLATVTEIKVAHQAPGAGSDGRLWTISGWQPEN
jgi:hypothetical protein